MGLWNFDPEEGAKTVPLPSFILTNIKKTRKSNSTQVRVVVCHWAEKEFFDRETEFILSNPD
jgi:hypothetical protein